MRSEGQKQSQAHERRLAERIGGQVRPASGAFPTAKGDVRQARSGTGSSWSVALIEHKWTGQKQIAIKASVLEKIQVEALLEGRIPVLGISLNNKNYVILDENDFLEMQAINVRLTEDLLRLQADLACDE